VSTTPPTKPPVCPQIVLSAPPHGKKPNEMSEDEIGAWADSIFDFMEAQRPIVDAASAYLKGER